MFTNERLEMTDQAGKKPTFNSKGGRQELCNQRNLRLHVIPKFREATFLSEFIQYNGSIDRDRLK